MKKAVWGWLYPLRDELKPLELKKDEYIFGTDLSCSYVLSESHFDKLSFKDLSKKQFKILKKKDGIYLEDLDSTYVNNKKVGKGQRVPLVHNNYIAIAKMHIKVFAFLERTESDKAALALPDEINEKYHQSRELGKGGFGEVSLVFEKNTGKRFALKIVKKHRDILKYTRTEAEIMRKISHPCIVMTEQVIDKLSSSAMFIVMEYMDGGNLLERIYPYKSLNESNMKLIFFQLVQAIQCLHQHNYVHRDIKPENVLLASRTTDPLVKVTDFGVSKILRPGTVMDTHVGTPMYIAPEMENRQQEYTKQVDVWSMGVLLYFCLSGTFPFEKTASASKTVVSFPNLKWLRMQNAVTLVKAMLQPIPTLRITVDEILKHSWLQDETMRKRAHQLMWPDMPYKSPYPRAGAASSPRAAAAASPRAGASASPRAAASASPRAAAAASPRFPAFASPRAAAAASPRFPAYASPRVAAVASPQAAAASSPRAAAAASPLAVAAVSPRAVAAASPRAVAAASPRAGASASPRAVAAASPRAAAAASPRNAAAASPRASISSQYRGIQARGVLQYQKVYDKPL